MSILSSFPKISATRKRPNGSDVSGHWVETTPTSTTISVIPPQPANGTELQLLPDGEREYTHLKVWSTAELATDDVLTISGVDYLVVLSMDYDSACARLGFDGFYKALIRRVQ